MLQKLAVGALVAGSLALGTAGMASASTPTNSPSASTPAAAGARQAIRRIASPTRYRGVTGPKATLATGIFRSGFNTTIRSTRQD